MRLIDANKFDRMLAAHEFDSALMNADNEGKPFRKQIMYYSTDSFRNVMSCQPTVEAIPVEWLTNIEHLEDEELTIAANTVLREWLAPKK